MGFYLEHHLTNARSQINELHLAGDRRDQINHLVDQIETGLPVDFRGERLIMIQVIWIADGSVVHLISLELVEEERRSTNLLKNVLEHNSTRPLSQPPVHLLFSSLFLE